jgi:hypothetical protein
MLSATRTCRRTREPLCHLHVLYSYKWLEQTFNSTDIYYDSGSDVVAPPEAAAWVDLATSGESFTAMAHIEGDAASAYLYEPDDWPSKHKKGVVMLSVGAALVVFSVSFQFCVDAVEFNN